MSYQRLPGSNLTLYAELLDQAIQTAASEVASGVFRGTLISKQIKGLTYWYLQRSTGAKKHQEYLGPDSPSLTRWMERAKISAAEVDGERKNLKRLAKMLVSGGASKEPAAILQALRLLSDSRVFQLGGVLVGTLAFRAYANLLGVRFEQAALQTQDLDIAQDPAIGVALARESTAIDLEQLLEASGLNLHPVPPLDPKCPSTSFKVRGRELRIDFLTPMRGRESQTPVYLPAFRMSAQPLRHLEYLLEPVTQAAIVGNDAILVNLPDPAHFALHKLWISTRRSPTFQTKARKDVLQASQVLEVLLDDRPDDVRYAWQKLPTAKSRERVLRAASKLEPDLKEHLIAVTAELG